jgi:glycosyltransferase involved in cell wall biosynthesis
VTSRWLEKLIDAAASSGDTGTVTPLSNNATLCSVPRGFEENLLPTGFDAASFAALVERVSHRSYPRIPTGSGFCLYIRRALLDDIGFFDAGRFGFGYGEENDFCMRALARGWVHLADDATFIYHAGHRSFSASRRKLQRDGAAALRRLHPRYMPTIAHFMKVDPLAEVRARIEQALRPRGASAGRLRVVHLVHGWPPFQNGGTELYASWLVGEQAATRQVAVYARAADPLRDEHEAFEQVDRGARVRFVTNNFTARDPFRRNALRDRTLECDFERFLWSEQPDLLHIHHLAGHTFSLAGVARRMGIPIVLQVQDWWFLCARVNFFDRGWNRCSGPAIGKCSRCAPLTRIAPAPLWNRLLHIVRRSSARRALRTASAFVAGSESIRKDYLSAGAIPGSRPFRVIPYGITVVAPAEARRPLASPIRFGYVGSIAPHKGVHIAVEAMRRLEPSQATLHLWGDGTAFPDYVETLKRNATAAVVFEGTFHEVEKPQVFASMDLLLVPSVGLESFGLAAREAMVSGVPVIASSGGALSEMFEPDSCGDFFPPGDAMALSTLLQRVSHHPEIVDRWATALRTPKRFSDHALEIDRLYETVLAGPQK